ncbi:hypothetical protein RYX36_031765, partial [Vicia faba]
TSVLLSVGQSSNKSSTSANVDRVLFNGIVPVLIASVLSGIASSLCQWASHVKKHSSYLMTIEISIDGSTCLLASTLKSPDGEAIRRHGFFSCFFSASVWHNQGFRTQLLPVSKLNKATSFTDCNFNSEI